MRTIERGIERGGGQGRGPRRAALLGGIAAMIVVAAPAAAQIDRDMDWARDTWRNSQTAASRASAGQPGSASRQLQKRRAVVRREVDRPREVTKAASRAGDTPARLEAAPREAEPAAGRTVVAAVAPAPATRSSARAPEAPAAPPAPRREAPGAAQPPDPMVAVISLASQHMSVYTPSGRLLDTRVSTGKPGHATPQGIYSIIQRNRHHRSNIYSGAPMPYMQRITWSGIALHQGVVPNHPASHGCIRLPNEVAVRMWAVGRMGMRIIITDHDVKPVEIAHPRLPVPVTTPVAASELHTAVRTAAVGDPAAAASEPRLVGPYQLSHVRKVRAARAVTEAESAVRPAVERTQAASAAANEAGDRLRAQQAAIAGLEEKLEELRDQIRRVQTPEAEAPIKAAIAAATAELEAASGRLGELRSAEMAASDTAFDAVKAMREAEAAVAAANETARLANWGSEPVSILVSRKEGRVYVRQSFNQIHEEPIEIGEPGRPLGTHVFTAMDTVDGEAGLRWMAVTVPSTPPEVLEAQRQSRQARGREAPVPRHALPASTAREALDRIELPERTRRLIADRLWPGATLIVSDYAASNETGRGTDFIVQPR